MRPIVWLQLFVGLGAALLFAMEPMVGQLLLPSFGGAFHVWTTSLMFFQGALFIGYLYAHLVAPRLGRLHLLVLLAPIVFLPFGVPPTAASPNVWALAWVLIAKFGLPFIALASTSVVAQQWLVSSNAPGRDEPYRLYASSNAGSLLALLGYVLLIDPLAGLRLQGNAWALVYLAYVVLAAWSFRVTKPEMKAIHPPRPPWSDLTYWTLVAAAPSALSMAVTNVFMVDIGSAPLVWVLPLTTYLMTFILVFGRMQLDPLWLRRLWPHLAVLGIVAYNVLPGVDSLSPIAHLAVLFFVGTAAHAELHRSRPKAESLTWFYLALSLGGWIGAAFVALIAPYAFDGLWEYPISLIALLVIIGVRRKAWRTDKPRIVMFTLLATVALIAIFRPREVDTQILARTRSPYGVYRVSELVEHGRRVRRLASGRTIHGRQEVRDGELVDEPLSYYHREGPLGDLVGLLDRPRRIGAVGLGVGAAAAQIGEGELIRFHEIDPVVVELAREHFAFLDGAANVEVETGDARHTLAAERREHAEPYDLLLVDAFSGDAVPLHLVTREAMELFADRIVPGGLIAFHISSRYVDLQPVLGAGADAMGLDARVKSRSHDLAPLEDPSRYVVVGPSEVLDRLDSAGWSALPPARLVFTDDRASVLPLLSAGGDP